MLLSMYLGLQLTAALLLLSGHRGDALFLFTNRSNPYLVDTFALPSVQRTLPEPLMSNFGLCLANPSDAVLGARHYGPFPPRWPGEVHLTHLKVSTTSFPILNVTRSLLETDSVVEQIRLLKRKTPVILTVFNNEFVHISKGYVHLLKAWLAHIARLGLLEHVLLVGSTWDNKDECGLLSMYAPCWVHTPSMNLGAKDGAGGRKLAADTRWLYVDALLRAGFDVVLSDADAFFLENPLPHFPANLHVVGLNDRMFDGSSDMEYCKEAKSLCQSTAFTMLRSTPETRLVVSDFLEQLCHGGGWEQQMWQEFAMRLGDKYAMLNTRGHNTFSNWHVVKHAIEASEDISVVVLHMGAVSGDMKVTVFKCLQLWLELDNVVARV